MASSTSIQTPMVAVPQSVASSASASTNFPPINIGTRRSALAQIQARSVERALKEAHVTRTFAIHAVLAQGDKDKVTPLQQLSQGENAKSLWTGELEEMLVRGDLDLIVHCLKDMPTQLPSGLTIGAILPREDPRDALVLSPRHSGATLATLPPGATIGTSSIRRTAQLRRSYPTLQFADLRGNVGTRLGKLDAAGSPYSAIILAAAGLKRMGMEHRISQYLTGDNGGMMYAVGQGALAVEIREDDDAVRELLRRIHCEKSAMACSAERALLRTLEGGCSVPIGVETRWKGGRGVATGAEPAKEYARDGRAVEGNDAVQELELSIHAAVVSVDGTKAVEAMLERKARSVEEAETIGCDLARSLIGKGADGILEQISREKQWAAKRNLDLTAAS